MATTSGPASSTLTRVSTPAASRSSHESSQTIPSMAMILRVPGPISGRYEVDTAADRQPYRSHFVTCFSHPDVTSGAVVEAGVAGANDSPRK